MSQDDRDHVAARIAEIVAEVKCVELAIRASWQEVDWGKECMRRLEIVEEMCEHRRFWLGKKWEDL